MSHHIRDTPGWTSDELDRIDAGEELRIASLRADDTLRNPVTIWVVRDGGDLYVRSVDGPAAQWFRGTRDGHQLGSGPRRSDSCRARRPTTQTGRTQ